MVVAKHDDLLGVWLQDVLSSKMGSLAAALLIASLMVFSNSVVLWCEQKGAYEHNAELLLTLLALAGVFKQHLQNRASCSKLFYYQI